MLRMGVFELLICVGVPAAIGAIVFVIVKTVARRNTPPPS